MGIRQKDTLTIIQNVKSLKYYAFERLSPAVRARINDAIADYSSSRQKSVQVVLKLLECFLQINENQPYISLVEHLDDFIKPFVGVLWTDFFIKVSNTSRYLMTQLFLTVIRALKNNTLSEKANIFIDRNRYYYTHEIYHLCTRFYDDHDKCIRTLDNIYFLSERMDYWRGWWSYNKTNMPWFIPLNGVYYHYGLRLTNKLFFQLNKAYSGARQFLTSGVSVFCHWLPQSGFTEEQFEDPHAVDVLFQQFLLHFMTKGFNNGAGSDIKQLIKRWQVFVAFAENHLLNHVFAKPIGKIVMPAPATIKGSERRIKNTPEGIEVKEKLLTDIPLHVTDEEAIELLFKQIQTDYDHIVNTATILANDLWQRYERRKQLALNGQVKPSKAKNNLTKKERQWIIHKDNPEWLANAAATFETVGFVQVEFKQPLVCSSYSISKAEMAYALGLPTAYALIPYMALLVSEHPNIVASFLTEFELYDEQERLTGFVELDHVWVLDGCKHRAGAENAQQIVILTGKSKRWIEEIIAITDCIRQHLKRHRDDGWRYLFLTSGRAFVPTRMQSQYAHARTWTGNNSFYDKLCVPSLGMAPEQAKKLSDRFNLGTLRASKGVLIYLKTHDVKAMAKALGHKEYSPKTLSHYLPALIFDFFQSRWIRLFQQGMIVEAMKESHYLLEAAAFNSMNEFHIFMKNHALKKIPEHLEYPELSVSTRYSNIPVEEIVFNINTVTLTLLLSLQAAVIQAKQPVCGKARYWSQVTEHVVARIEQGSDYGTGEELKHYLIMAKKQANPKKLEALIYA